MGVKALLLPDLMIGLCCLVGVMTVEAFGSSGDRDPFAFPTGVHKALPGQKTEGGGPEKAGPSAAQVFRVTTILISGQNRVAAINGVLLRKGDSLEGYRIETIEEKQVVLERGKDKIVLHIDSGDKYFFKKTNLDRRLSGSSQ